MRSNTPLSMKQLQEAVPAAFQDKPHQNRSERYVHVTTLPIIEAMNDAGYGVSRAQQKKTRSEEARGFTRHLLAFRPLDAFTKNRVGDAIPEILLINSHDALCSFKLYAGLFRLVCENGMIVGTTFAQHSIIHRGDAAQQVVEASGNIMDNYVPKLRGWVKGAQERILAPKEQSVFASAAAAIRHGDNVPYDATELLKVRREQDKGDDLWHVYNRVQEGLMRGGIEGTTATGRRSVSRPIERVTKDVLYNQQLWDLASSYLEAA